MKFGLMYEIQIPEPHYPGIERDVYKQVLEQVTLADEVGFDHFWTVEHHFLKEFSHCSAPEVLYGAISQRTSNIRIGHAVALLPPQYNHPVRVAERAAVLDILSDGRCDLGTGRSTTLIEMDGFQISPDETRAMWEEAVGIIPRMWTEDPFEARRPLLQDSAALGHSQAGAGAAPAAVGRLRPAGKFLRRRRKGPRRPVLQHRRARGAAQPHRQLPQGHCQRQAGRQVRQQPRWRRCASCIAPRPTRRPSTTPACHGLWFMDKTVDLYQPWRQKGGEVPDSYKFAVNAIQKERAGRTIQDYVDGGTFCIGSPDTCIETIKKYEEQGVDQVLCFMQYGKLPHDKIMSAMRLMGKHVMPYFRQ